MQKNVLIALAIIGTLTAGYMLFRRHPKQEVDTEATALKDVYNQWKVNYKINVGAAEDGYRFKVFSANYKTITVHNKLLGRSFDMGLNAFAHLTKEEFSATKLGLKLPKDSKRNVSALSTVGIPTNVDWTSKMNPIKNQASCGSCWAFSAVGALEGLWSVQKGQLYSLSEQELVDCSGSYGNEGCNGGLMDNAFQYAIDNKGLASEADYSYKGVDGTCKTGLTHYAPISGFTDVTVGSSDALKAALAQQPVSVAIEADTSTFQFYSGGVITSTSCGTDLDHGVVAVGYNTDASPAYYNVRNSWGSSWGDKGYVKIGIVDGDGICGIQMAASYPTL